MPKQSKLNNGFTLIELLIVVTIIAILAAIAIPSYQGIQRKASRTEAKSNLQAIALALEGHMAENNDYGPAGVYTYFRTGGFGHPGNLEIVANLGNRGLYEYRVNTISTPIPVFSIIATPNTGRALGDITIWIDSAGNKGPNGAGW